DLRVLRALRVPAGGGCVSVQVRSQLAGALRSSQLLFRSNFDLTDALAREAERVADLLQRARLAVAIEAEAELDDLALPVVELAERVLQPRVQAPGYQLFLGRRHARLREQLPQLGPLVVGLAAEVFAEREIAAADPGEGLDLALGEVEV